MSAFATGSTGFEKFAGRGVALAPPQRPVQPARPARKDTGRNETVGDTR